MLNYNINCHSSNFERDGLLSFTSGNVHLAISKFQRRRQQLTILNFNDLWRSYLLNQWFFTCKRSFLIRIDS
jgi:hypothetical protein